MTELRGTEVFDGATKIADIVREANSYAKEGFVLALVPTGDKHWKKYMGREPDIPYIAQMWACVICGGCAHANYLEPTKSRLLASRLCHGCDHWNGLIAGDAGVNKDRAVVVDGKHYMMSPNTERPHRWSGFGGHEFHIRFHDGREATCNNLWCQGTIPERWRDQLPDNAVFVRPAVRGDNP